MEKLSVSKEFVLAAHAAACEGWKEKIKNEFPDLFPSKKVGQWWKASDGLFRISKIEDNKIYEDNKLNHDGEDWGWGNSCYHMYSTAATKEEIEKHLIALAEKKGLVKGANTRPINSEALRVAVNYNTTIGGSYTYYMDEDILCDSGGGNIYCKGVWAEIIQEPVIVEITMDEIAKLKGCDVSQLKIKK